MNLSLIGPLRVHPKTRRYFSDAAGWLVYMTGTHTWNSLQEREEDGFASAFDYQAYLDFLQLHGHNCFRKWVWEFSCGVPDGRQAE